MSWMRYKNVAFVGAGVAAAAFLLPRTLGQVAPNGFETPAVKSVANRHSMGGGTTTHTPAVATPRGTSEKNHSNVETPKGVGSRHFEDNFASQKPGQPNRVEAAFHKAHYGEENTKGK